MTSLNLGVLPRHINTRNIFSKLHHDPYHIPLLFPERIVEHKLVRTNFMAENFNMFRRSGVRVQVLLANRLGGEGTNLGQISLSIV